MRPVLITCPETGILTATGITARSLDELAAHYTLGHCPDCGGSHDWTPADAVLADVLVA